MEEDQILTQEPENENEELKQWNEKYQLKEGEVRTPEVLPPQGSFPAAFGSEIGNSTVDLSIPENQAKMKEEYNEWWHLGKKRGLLGIPYKSPEFKGERDKLKEKWYNK